MFPLFPLFCDLQNKYILFCIFPKQKQTDKNGVYPGGNKHNNNSRFAGNLFLDNTGNSDCRENRNISKYDDQNVLFFICCKEFARGYRK